jgi:putative addiction module antidote
MEATMSAQLKIIQVGNSLGVILPTDVLAALKAGKGDTLSVIEMHTGISLQKSAPDFETDMRIADDIMNRYRNALTELAK